MKGLVVRRCGCYLLQEVIKSPTAVMTGSKGPGGQDSIKVPLNNPSLNSDNTHSSEERLAKTNQLKCYVNPSATVQRFDDRFQYTQRRQHTQDGATGRTIGAVITSIRQSGPENVSVPAASVSVYEDSEERLKLVIQSDRELMIRVLFQHLRLMI